MGRSNKFLATSRKQRFEERIYYCVSGCWIWTASCYSNGYGQFYDNCKIRIAHRISYELYKGDPTGFHVLHSCDNPKCVNPDHLSLGNDADNSLDKVKKGRQARGSKMPQSKLDALQVKVIHSCFPGKFFQREIGNYFKISQTAVSKILLGKHWKHI